MQFQTRIFFGLCACVAFVQCQQQVTVGKVGGKTFILLEGSKNVDWDTSESMCKAKGLQFAALENSRENGNFSFKPSMSVLEALTRNPRAIGIGLLPINLLRTPIGLTANPKITPTTIA
ncbi:unnamed protein product [Allacma fusca]|uniref:C-type lectin domain-containing protein n=1 Tax=Allacma fusca TaxID=39272 RepID=A0A8J2JJH6_9HEXA|nr:unnamed protein product [Allacma fusca]